MSRVEIDTAEAEALMSRLANMLGPRKTVTMNLQRRAMEILEHQALAGRNVTNTTPAEAQELAEIAAKHIAAARDERGRIDAGTGASAAMFREMGELARDMVADRIADVRHAEKAALSEGYKRQKLARFGRTEPILVATGELLAAVARAQIRLEDR